jgi:hypothetical protein
MTASVVFFQNCTSSHDGGVKAASTNVPPFSLLNTDADYVWTLQNGITSLSLLHLNDVAEWRDGRGAGVFLYAPLQYGSNQIDLTRTPTLGKINGGSIVNFSVNQTLQSFAGDQAAFLGQEYSFALYVRNLKLPVGPPPPLGIPVSTSLQILQFMPFDGSADSGTLTLQVGYFDVDHSQIYAQAWFSAGYAMAAVTVANTDLAGGFGIALRFSNDPAKMLLAVNGQTSTFTSWGTPPLLGDVARQLSVNGSIYGTGWGFELSDLAMWKRALSDKETQNYALALQQVHDGGAGGALSLSPSPGSVVEGGTLQMYATGGTSPYVFSAGSCTSTIDPESGLFLAANVLETCTVTVRDATQKKVTSQISVISSSTLTFADVQPSFQTCTGCHTSQVDSLSDILAAVGPDGVWITPGSGAGSLLVKALRRQAGVLPMPQPPNPPLDPSVIDQISQWIDQGAH